MALPNHFKELSITDMVYQRIVFLSKVDSNDELISQVILEVMSGLDYCFNIDAVLEDLVETNIGNEAKYSLPQRIIIADVVSVALLEAKVVGSTGGVASDTEDGVANNKLLTATVAGSVEAEWEQTDARKGGLATSAEHLLGLYRDSSRIKMAQLGCTLAWTEEQMQADLDRPRCMAPFLVVPYSKCN